MLALHPKAVWHAFRSEHFAFICTSIYLLLEYLKPEQAYPIFGILPFLRLAVLVALAGFFLDKQAKLARSPLNWLILLFLLQCALSSWYAYDSEYSFSRLNIITNWVIVFFLISGIVNSERRLFLFLLVYFLANFKMSQFGIFSWARRGFGFASWGITGAGWFRNSGELGLEMSVFFAYTLCFALFLRRYWTGWIKWLMYFLPISAFGCVIASSSRGAIIGVVGVLLYLSFFSKKRVRAWIACAVALYLGYLIMPSQFLARFHTAGEDPTSLSRIAYWAKAHEMLSQHPYFGVGYYNWYPYYRDHYFDPSLYWRVEQAHNTYLQMGAELGFPGLGIFLTMVLVSFVINAKSARLAKRDGFEFLRALALAMNAAGAGLVLGSAFLTAFFLPNYWIHFALTVCLQVAVRKKIEAADRAAGGSTTLPAAGGQAYRVGSLHT
jgi:O-antigen ligase